MPSCIYYIQYEVFHISDKIFSLFEEEKIILNNMGYMLDLILTTEYFFDFCLHCHAYYFTYPVYLSLMKLSPVVQTFLNFTRPYNENKTRKSIKFVEHIYFINIFTS